jgi:hypothetical protein
MLLQSYNDNTVLNSGKALPIWGVLDCQLSDETGSAALYVIALIEMAQPAGDDYNGYEK